MSETITNQDGARIEVRECCDPDCIVVEKYHPPYTPTGMDRAVDAYCDEKLKQEMGEQEYKLAKIREAERLAEPSQIIDIPLWAARRVAAQLIELANRLER